VSDRLFNILRALFYGAWILLTAGCIVAVWEGNDATLGGGLAASAGIVIGSIFCIALINVFMELD
jgi:hypothetical protein